MICNNAPPKSLTQRWTPSPRINARWWWWHLSEGTSCSHWTELRGSSSLRPLPQPTLHPPPSWWFPENTSRHPCRIHELAWQAILTPKFFIRFYDYDGRDSPNKHPGLVSRLQKSLEIIAAHAGTNEPTLKISPPSAPALPNVAPPSTFLVYGTLQLLCNTILSQQVWSVPQVTFETYPFESYIIPSIFLCLAGYICPDENTVINSVKTAWLQSPAKEQMVDIILSIDKSFSGAGAYLRAQNMILNMVNSILVEFLDFRTSGGGPSPRWNIYVMPPTTHILTWSKVQAHAFQMSHPCILNGTGTTCRLFSCSICHSFDHPHSLCPFPNTPAWNGPLHITKHFSVTSMRECGRGRGRGQSGTDRQS